MAQMPSLVDRLRTEAELCTNDGAEDVAALINEAADALENQPEGGRVTRRRVIDGVDIYTVNPTYAQGFEVIRYNTHTGKPWAGWLCIFSDGSGQCLTDKESVMRDWRDNFHAKIIPVVATQVTP